jgi:hypothetical protein
LTTVLRSYKLQAESGSCSIFQVLGLLLWLLAFCGVLSICGYGRRKHQRHPESRALKHSSASTEAHPASEFHNAALLGHHPGEVSPSPDGSMMTPQMSQLGRSGTGAMSSRTMFGGASTLSAADKAGAMGLAAPIALGQAVGIGAPPDKQRALLSSVRDENQSGEHLILPNSTVTVLWP